ncbi:MAG TPA: cysteine desulfurase family protein [Bryobacteraceae bacterium]|nr:cysteine desulfurase family protein [Bryobacteraceae bacterium]
MQHFYFDHNAASPVAPEVLRDLTDAMAEVFGNASSIHHFGQAAKRRLEAARRRVAARLGCSDREIVFTSGGTESDNLAIFGVARGGGHIVTTSIEHPAVLNACAQLEREGVEVTWLPVSFDGRVDAEDVRRALRPNTALISAMHVNNETGVLQPVAEIAQVARAAGIPFHSDGVQAGGRIPVNVRDLGIDLYSISGHKFGAPKGVGVLYVRKGVDLAPLLHGGRHERSRRAGTENVVGAGALARAMELTFEWETLAALRDRLEAGILERVPGTTVNGNRAYRAPNTSNIRFEAIEGEAMVIALDLRGYAVSSGSACSSGAVEPSHVLLAMGLSPDEARSSVRFSLGPGNTAEQVDGLVEAVADSAAHLRRISPVALSSAGVI